MKKATNVLILAMFLVLVASLLVQKQYYETTIAEIKTEESFKRGRIVLTKNKAGQVVAEQVVIPVTDKKITKDVYKKTFKPFDKELKKVKKVNTVVSVEQTAKLDTVFVSYIDSTQANDSTLTPPIHFKDSCQQYHIEGTVELKGVQITKLSIPDTVSFAVVKTKGGLFRKAKTMVFVVHSNSHVQTEGIQSITLQEKKSFYQRVIKPTLFFGAGVFLRSKL